MDIFEANKIFKSWQQWYWPCHCVLWRVFFFSGIPESFLPYPKDVLEDALNIVAKSYWDEGDRKTSNLISGSISALIFYKKDEEAFQKASKDFSNPETMKAIYAGISLFKKDWIGWLEKLEKRGGKYDAIKNE